MSSPEKLPESPAVPKAPEAIVTPEDVPTIEAYSVSTPWKDAKTGQLDLLRMARGARGLLAMEWGPASARLAQLGLTRRSASDGRSLYYHMLSFALSKPGVPEAYRTSLAREFPPADAMASVLAAMLAKYEKRDEARTMDDILKEVVNELSAPDRLRAKIAEYRANMPGKATMKDDEIAAELTAGYRRAADLAIARSVYGRIPDPSKVISARVLELRSARLTEIEKQEQAEEKKRLEKGLPPRTWLPREAIPEYHVLAAEVSDFYRSEAFGKFRAAFAAELRQARDIQENSLFALAAIESVRQGKDPVTAVRLAYPPQPPKAPGSSAQAWNVQAK